MFHDNDLDPKAKKPQPRDLENLSVEELAEYIVDLKDEIQRAEKDIQAKGAQKSAADAFFK